MELRHPVEETLPRSIEEPDLVPIIDVVRQNPDGVPLSAIAAAMPQIPQRTLQRWLKRLVDDGRLRQEGAARAARYRMPAIAEVQEEGTLPEAPSREGTALPLSAESEKIQKLSSAANRSKKASRV
jgi:hypothetical protein